MERPNPKGKSMGRKPSKANRKVTASRERMAGKVHPKHAQQAHAAKEGAHAGKKDAGKAMGKESAVKFDERQLEQTGALKVYEVLEYPLVSEKAVNMIDGENKIVFVVNRKATKADVRKAVETMYNVKVDRVNVCRDMKARKKAFVKINKAFKADELATKLGVL